jgi:hypothetical protein
MLKEKSPQVPGWMHIFEKLADSQPAIEGLVTLARQAVGEFPAQDPRRATLLEYLRLWDPVISRAEES